MRVNLTKGLVATSLALALSSFGSVQAGDIIQFDPDGTAAANGTYDVGAFDWSTGSALADNSTGVFAPDSFQLYFHAALNGYIDTGGNPANFNGLNVANTGFEITVIGGFRETQTVTSTAQTLESDGGDGQGIGGNDVYRVTVNANLEFASGDSNFLRMYYDDFTDASGQKSDALTGLGYNDGLLILEAEIIDAVGTIAAFVEFVDENDNGVYDSGVDTVVPVNLDNFNANNWLDVLTATTDGSTSLLANILSTNGDFFKTALSQVLQDVDFTTETNTPFEETNPSRSFDDGSGGTVALGSGLDVGDINGSVLPGGDGSGPDFLLQADASNSFTRATVPEPSVLALLGLGLMGLALSRRKVTN